MKRLILNSAILLIALRVPALSQGLTIDVSQTPPQIGVQYTLTLTATVGSPPGTQFAGPGAPFSCTKPISCTWAVVSGTIPSWLTPDQALDQPINSNVIN